jgi:hypothetical protein
MNITQPHKKIKVRHRNGVKRKRVVHMLGGCGPATLYNVHNPSLVNLVRGVNDRVFMVDYGRGLQSPIRPSHRGFRESVDPAFKFLRRNRVALRRWTYDQLVDHYRVAQLRKRYERAKLSVEEKPLSRRDAWVKTFVKAEKVNFSAKNDPAPRIISPRDPRYNLVVGTYIKPIEGFLYKLLNKMCGGRTVMKGLNSIQTAEAMHDAWSEFSDPVGVPLDAKRFDQHTHTAALKFEQLVYLLFFHGVEKEELRTLLMWQLVSECAGYTPEGFVKFVMMIRASGDMNTGLGTCLIACALIYSYLHRRVAHWRLINNGDDCVIIVEKKDLHKLDGLFKHCKRAGYWMVIEKPVSTFEEIEFCQCKPVLTGNGWRMVRTFPTSMAKDMVSLLPLRSMQDWKKWANDIGNCGLALNSGVPVLQTFYDRIRQLGGGSFGDHPFLMRSGMWFQAQDMESEATPITQDARYSFYLAFGLSPAEQEAIEEHIRLMDITLEPGCMGNYNIDTLRQRLHTFYDEVLNITQN